MRHIIGIGMKFFLILAVLVSIFSVISVEYIDIMLLTGTILVIASYLIGDLFIVPRFGNLIGTIADFGLALIVILAAGLFTTGMNFLYLVAAISAAFLIATGENLFHYYVQMVLNKDRKDIYEEPSTLTNELNTNNLQTEISEELNPTLDKNKK